MRPFDPATAERLRRAAAALIAAVALFGVIGAVVVDRPAEDLDASRARVEPDAASDPGAATAADPGEAEPSPAGGAVPVDETGTSVPPSLPSSSVVPGDATYRYEVTSTTDGSSSLATEELEVVRLSGDDTVGVVQLSQRIDGNGQRSVLDWSPSGASVRSTEIDDGDECVWEPPVTEFGAFEAGATWETASRCQTTVAGAATVVEVTGRGHIVGSETITVAGSPIAVWRIERSRASVLSATIGGKEVIQQVDEVGVVFFDPARGIAVRRESTVTRTGPQSGTTQRTAVLQA